MIRWDSNQEALHFAMACVLGYYLRERRHIEDPDAPKGLIVTPLDPTITTILHQFAIALLCLEEECPQNRLCMCNHIRARFNAPPPDHEQPTGELPAVALRRAIECRNDAGETDDQ